MRVAAIILAAGKSTRFGQNKMHLQVGGQPVWRRSFEAFLNHPGVDAVGIVCATDDLVELSEQAPEALFVRPGGRSRQGSALIGLQALPQDTEIVLIHDAARPFITEETITWVIEGVEEHRAACPALAVKDTIKQTTPDGRRLTLDRSLLSAVQTPQGGYLQDFLRAHAAATSDATDDLALLEQIGIIGALVPGDERNLKLTTPADLDRIKTTMDIRTGLGYDIHAFSDDPHRKLMLGGVHFPEGPALEGHSDADVVLHAVTDALLGAVSMGDIGVHFPNTDPEWKDKASHHFLTEAQRMLKEAGWEVVNIDISVLAEKPKIMVRRTEICQAIAQAAQVPVDRVSIKATTQEKLGAIGRGEGIAAFAIATVRRPD